VNKREVGLAPARAGVVDTLRARRSFTSAVKTLFLLVLLVLYLFPFFMVILNSLKRDTEVISSPIALPSSIYWENYRIAFEKMKFMRAFTNSLIITAASVAAIVLLGSMCAYYLVRNKTKLSTFLYLTMVAAMIIPFQAIMIPLLKIYGSIGMLNNHWVLVFMYIGFGVPLAIFLFHGFIKAIPRELEEAATVDGCGRYAVFFKIVLPLLQPVIMTVVILDVLWIWNDFLLPSLVLLSQASRTLPLSTYYFYGTYTVNYGPLLASLVMTMIPVIIMYMFSQRFILKGIIAGAIK
jgi:raffinose/stachyose/melibiose transport system permease protein